jgi:hypothetical protein
MKPNKYKQFTIKVLDILEMNKYWDKEVVTEISKIAIEMGLGYCDLENEGYFKSKENEM